MGASTGCAGARAAVAGGGRGSAAVGGVPAGGKSLHGIAIVLVYAFHVDGVVLFPWNAVGKGLSPALAFVRAGHTGVDLFFILSAFLLSLPFLAAARGGRPVHLGRYFTRRALRILPLYYAAVVVAAVMTASRPADLERALPYLAFMNSVSGWYTAMPPYSDVWWSLCTEVQFYLLLPLVGARPVVPDPAPPALRPSAQQGAVLERSPGAARDPVVLDLHDPRPPHLAVLGTLRKAGVPGLYGWNWRTGTVVGAEAMTCLGLAALTYRVIEWPFLTRKARLGA